MTPVCIASADVAWDIRLLAIDARNHVYYLWIADR